MVLALAALLNDLHSMRNQILSAPTVPTYDMVSEQLLHLSTSHVFGHSSTSASSADSFTLVSHSSPSKRYGDVAEVVVGRIDVAIIVKFMVILNPIVATRPDTNRNQQMLPRSLILPPLRMTLSPLVSIMISFSVKQPNNLPRLLLSRLSLVIL